MIRNYLKVAWRNLINNKVYSAINIFGLSAGMAVAMLIALWVVNEFQYDRFLPDNDRLYQVRRNFDNNGDTMTFNAVSLKLADVLRSEVPEMEYVCETDWFGNHGLKVGDRKVFMYGGAVQGDFLKAFQFPLLQGNPGSVLQEPYSIVLTASAAATLFGKEDAMGKMVRVDNRHDLKVAGILKDVPANSSLQFQYLIPFSYLDKTADHVIAARSGDFSENSFQIFAKLKPGVSYGQVAGKIRDIERRETNNINARKSTVIMQALTQWHLYGKYENGKSTGGYIEYVRIFSLIGLLVLLIACINFVNLTTARSEKRAKEVGIRKAVGSRQGHLVMQFLAESVMLTFIALCFTLLLVALVLPAFNTLTGAVIRIPFDSIPFWLITLLCVVFTGLAAGLKPAFYLSSFSPVKTLKGRIQVGRSATFSRKALVVVQFTCSIVLVISTMVVYRQMQYVRDRPTGYDTNKLLVTEMFDDLNKNYAPLKHDLLQSGLVTNVARASSPATGIYWHSNLDYFPGQLPGETVEMGVVRASDNYLSTMGMQLLSGRDFTADQAADSGKVILNEAAVKRLRLKDPLNTMIIRGGDKFIVSGVVKDALIQSPFGQPEPTMFIRQSGFESFIMYRLAPAAEPHKAIAALGAIFERYNPAYPYKYEFANETYNRKFKQEVLVGRLAGIFAVLAIVISCLGLFGLAAYIAEQRTKEIGIRKVLGASIGQVWFMLSKDFITLVLVSCLIASPLALYFLQRWLMNYEYRITIGPGVFIYAAAMALVITLCTISFQAIRAAVADPVKSLRSE